MRISLLTASCLFLASCVTNGREFPSRTDWIQKNKTRQEDVKLVLGDPQAVGASDGIPSWTYGYYKYKLFGSSMTKELKFYWNPNQTIQSWSFTSSFPDDTTGVAPQAAKGAGDVGR